MSAFNKQIGGNHYKNEKYQVVEFLSDNLTPASLGYALKYITRYPNKNQDDLDKAVHCIELFEEWFKKNTVVEDDGNIYLFPYLYINLDQLLDYSHQFTAHKAILLQQVARLANLEHYVKDNILDFKAYQLDINYVKDSIIAYKEGLLE